MPAMSMSATAENIPQIDASAPDFEARSTRGIVRLADFRGRWLLFFSHPADFTPVCTSEFIAFEKARSRFEDRGCDILGLSVDSVFAHIAWLRDIEDRFGVCVRFPVIEDISMSVARAYGMVHDTSTSTAAVRSVFFIDPEGMIRAMIHHPAQIGRSVEELLRVLVALQATHDGAVSTPEGWTPGEPTLMPPPVDQMEAAERAQSTGAIWYVTPTDSLGRTRQS